MLNWSLKRQTGSRSIFLNTASYVETIDKNYRCSVCVGDCCVW
jgi:hypothetical protein